MKKSGEIRPVQIAARVVRTADKPARIEWSKLAQALPGPDDDDDDDSAVSEKHLGVLKRIRGWIDRQIGAQQPETRMLRRLHRSKKLEIILPEDAENDENLHGQLSEFWQIRELKHKRLALLTGLLLLPSVLLTLIPGPNVVGIGLTYLLYHHWRITQGIRRVRAGTIEVELKPASRTASPKEKAAPLHTETEASTES